MDLNVLLRFINKVQGILLLLDKLLKIEIILLRDHLLLRRLKF